MLSTEQEAWNRESNSLVQIPNMENRELANSVNGKIPDETLISLVEKSMKENPERIAIINNERKLSYGELERYSTGIGHILQRENVERNSLVAIVMEKGWEQIVAAISILKAGAAYLPIDPSFPEERVHLLLSVNGKVDRKALRKILGGYQGQISEEKKKEAPQGELEVKIAAIWERVLGTKEISRDDDFFMCGGDSLKAVKIISELNATEGLPNDLAIQTLFALPTVALLAEQIEKLVSLLDVEENTEYEEGVL